MPPTHVSSPASLTAWMVRMRPSYLTVVDTSS